MTRTRLARPLFCAAALYTLANGYVHLSQWLKGYRHIPGEVHGAWVVRLGFPAAAASSIALAALLLFAATKAPKLVGIALVSNFAFQFGSLGVLIATRVGSVFGWAEPSWTPGANLARAVDIGGIVVIGFTAILFRVLRMSRSAHRLTTRLLPAG